MKLSDRALSFAIRILDEKACRIETDKPEIIHSMIMGDLAKRYGFDDNVVAACYLHGINKEANNKITNNDIARLFGGDVASLVMTANVYSDSPLLDSQKQIIKACKNLPFRNKAVITFDIIASIEDLRITFQKNDYNDISDSYKENQQGFYESMLEVLEEDHNHPIFDRLYSNIIAVFYNRNAYHNKEIAGSLNQTDLRSINTRQDELISLRAILDSPKPFIIEFTGTEPQKSVSLIDVMNDFFKEGFKIKVRSESHNGKLNAEYIPDYKSIDLTERNLLLASEVEAGLLSELASDKDILLLDRALFERLIWLQRYIRNGRLTKEAYDNYIQYYLVDLESIINFVVISYSKKDVNDNKKYEEALQNCLSLLKGDSLFADINQLTNNEAALLVFENLLPIMRADSIRQLKLFLETKKNSV